MTEIMDLSTFLSRYLGLLLVCCGFHLTYFQLFRFFAPSIAKDRKRLAWIITFSTAFFVSVISPFYTWGSLRTIFSSPTMLDTTNAGMLSNNHNYNYINHGDHHIFSAEFNSNNAAVPGWDSQEMNNNQPTIVTVDPTLLVLQKEAEISERTRPAIREDTGDRVLESQPLPASKERDQGKRQFRLFFDLSYTPADNDGTTTLAVFFMAYLIMDIILGLLYYREQVTLLAGWLHHTAYIGITYYAVTQGETFSYALFLPMEVPTIVIGIGCLDKGLRRDMLYGFMFIIFRILFDFSLTHEILWNRERELTTARKIILIFKSLMNLKFLLGWISQQKRLARKRRAEAATKASASTMAEASITANGVADNKNIVSITAPTTATRLGSVTSRKSMHVQREEHRVPITREDGAVSTSLESNSRRSARIRSKGVQENDLLDTQTFVEIIAVH